MSLQDNPPLMYSNFDKIVLTGGHKDEAEVMIDKDDS